MVRAAISVSSISWIQVGIICLQILLHTNIVCYELPSILHWILARKNQGASKKYVMRVAYSGPEIGRAVLEQMLLTGSDVPDRNRLQHSGNSLV